MIVKYLAEIHCGIYRRWRCKNFHCAKNITPTKYKFIFDRQLETKRIYSPKDEIAQDVQLAKIRTQRKNRTEKLQLLHFKKLSRICRNIYQNKPLHQNGISQKLKSHSNFLEPSTSPLVAFSPNLSNSVVSAAAAWEWCLLSNRPCYPCPRRRLHSHCRGGSS